MAKKMTPIATRSDAGALRSICLSSCHGNDGGALPQSLIWDIGSNGFRKQRFPKTMLSENNAFRKQWLPKGSPVWEGSTLLWSHSTTFETFCHLCLDLVTGSSTSLLADLLSSQRARTTATCADYRNVRGLPQRARTAATCADYRNVRGGAMSPVHFVDLHDFGFWCIIGPLLALYASEC